MGNLARLRHFPLARWGRAGVFRLLVGKEGWPLQFRAPETHDHLMRLASPHIYVHLPFCQSLCPHCPYNKRRYQAELASQYGQALLREIRAFLELHPDFRWETLYFGGGTPSLTPDIIEQVIALLAPHASPAPEIGVEVHPLHGTHAALARLHSLGVTHISLGVETFHAPSLRLLARGYTPRQAEQAIDQALRQGFACVDVNLIYAIPGQPPAASIADAAKVATMGVDQISAYPLFGFEHTPLASIMARKGLKPVSDRERLRAQKGIARTCLERGWQRASVWSYIRPGVRPYTTVTRESYLGFGAGAGSLVHGHQWFNTFSIPAYIAQGERKPALVLTMPPRLRRFHWVYWRIYETRLSYRAYRQRFGREFKKDFGLLAFLMKGLGWAREEDETLILTERGAVWAHRVQAFYSLAGIDHLWRAGMAEPWPDRVVLM